LGRAAIYCPVIMIGKKAGAAYRRAKNGRKQQ
jgi:hypothetical protein